MSFNSITKINLIKLFLFFSFLICWLSVSTSFDDLLIFKNDQQYDFKNIINFFRHFFVYFCFIFLIFLVITFRKNFFSKNNIVFHFYLGYLFSQIPGLIYSKNPIENISFVISSLTITLTTIFITQFFSSKEKRVFIYFSFLILLTLFSAIFIPHFVDFLKGGDYFYGFFQGSEILLDKVPPRSSGLARTCLILLLFTHVLENFIFKKNVIIFNIIKIMFLICILLFQSRTIIFITLISYLFIFIFENKISIKNFSKFMINYLIIPLILVNLISTFNLYKKQDDVSGLSNLSTILKKTYIEKQNLRSVKTGDVSSGRFGDWKKLIEETTKDKRFLLFGYGSQADRYLINQTASNGMIYALSSSGIIGITFYMSFSLLIIYQVLKLLLKSYKEYFNVYLYSLIILVILLRSLLETSYAVFSIDFIILIIILGRINNIKININEIKIKYLK